MFNARRASANAIINRVMSNANGIGRSKTEARNNSNITAENGHKVSDKAHSIKEMQNLRTVTTQYINFVKDNYAGKTAGNINAESAREFIFNKIADNVKGGTLNTYISALNKVADNLNKDNIGNLNREAIQNIKSDIKEVVELKSDHTNRAYENAEAIKQKMQDTIYALSTDLQAEAGLRANDSIDSSKWTINQNNTLTIHDSKGGLTYNTAPISHELIERVAEAKEMGYKANYEEYREALKEVAEATNQQWHGTHGLRYSFAQERIEQLREQGYTQTEAKGQVSLELGHSRLDITDHYTKF